MFTVLCGLLLISVTYADPEVRIRSGEIRGLKETASDGSQYYAFKGIRYAQPPLKQLRFKAPVPVMPWKEVQNATEDGNLCPQFDLSQNDVVGDEDCLFLNVYTNKLSGQRPVMVYIHGGSFINGGGPSYYYSPEYFLEQEVVVVTIQYRLGPLGFLSTGDKATTGNWALQDVILGLQWVQNNIESFGGDSHKITVSGEDSGAAIITFLLLSEKSKGLFHSAIALSGNALCDQFIQRNPSKAAKDLSEKLNCYKGGNTADMVECIRQRSMRDIITNSNSMFVFYSFPRVWAPVIDGDIIKEDPVILMDKGDFTKVPVMVGQTSDEGAFYYRLTLNAFNNGLYDNRFIDDKLPKLLPLITHYQRRLHPITRAVKRNYFVDSRLHKEDEFRPKYIDFLTDILFTRCTDKFARTLSNHSVPTYTYVFSYQGEHSITKFQGEKVNMGVAHGDDLQYLFSDIWGKHLKMADSDIHFGRSVFTTLLANFAKTNIPTPELTDDIQLAWVPYNQKEGNYYHIDKTLSSRPLQQHRLRLWNEDIPSMFAKDIKEIKKMEKERRKEEKEKKKQQKATTSEEASKKDEL